MRYVKQRPTLGITEYIAYNENQPPSGDIVIITYPESIHVFIQKDSNYHAIERGLYLKSVCDVEIDEFEFFTAYQKAHSAMVGLLGFNTIEHPVNVAYKKWFDDKSNQTRTAP